MNSSYKYYCGSTNCFAAKFDIISYKFYTISTNIFCRNQDNSLIQDLASITINFEWNIQSQNIGKLNANFEGEKVSYSNGEYYTW